MLRFCLTLMCFVFYALPSHADATCPDFLKHDLRKLHSAKTAHLCDLATNKKAVLFVNTASHCGFTEQFSGLEALHKKYKDQGLLVLGFPSDSFKQESKSEEDTARVCFKNFGVTFDMFETLPVRGKKAHPLFKYLAEQTTAPSWNFNKYLWVDGKLTHFGSRTSPLDSELETAIQMALQPPAAKPKESPQAPN
jgi:glutathione peroxidase